MNAITKEEQKLISLLRLHDKNNDTCRLIVQIKEGKVARIIQSRIIHESI